MALAKFWSPTLRVDGLFGGLPYLFDHFEFVPPATPSSCCSATRRATCRRETPSGFSTFRPGQQDAMGAILEGRDSLVILPTGGEWLVCAARIATRMRRCGRPGRR